MADYVRVEVTTVYEVRQTTDLTEGIRWATGPNAPAPVAVRITAIPDEDVWPDG